MTLSKTPENIRSLFNEIAGKYDFMNNLISFGLHKSIKEKSVKLLDLKPHSKVLDACCGTGDIIEIIKKIQPLAEVTGLDFSGKMLEIAGKRIENINFIQSDVTKLDFPDNNFDFVTMAFGLRNIQNPEKALNEVYRVLKPGGEFLHLDFGKKNFLSGIFDLEVPFMAKLFYGNKIPYEYLIKSKKNFPEPDELIEDFEKCGFKFRIKKDFAGSAISAQVMKK